MAAPANAENGSTYTGDSGKMRITAIAASPEPFEMPTTSGEASGFRITPCKIAPAAASPAPAKIANIMREGDIAG